MKPAKSYRMPVLLLVLLLLPTVAWAQEDWGDDDWGDDGTSAVTINGLVEVTGAYRAEQNPTQPGDLLANEARFRLALSHFTERVEIDVKSDILADAATGRTALDIRQALITLQASDALTVQAGRQIMTWGTGDLLFLNDLFPKDFVAFFIGRDDEFLKAPANAIRATWYFPEVNIDAVWLPRFTPDRYITGERLSFFDPLRGRRVGMNLLTAPVQAALPEATLENSEAALRLFRTFGPYEAALYGYYGFSKQPLAFDPATRTVAFAPLQAYGASVRGGQLGGITSAELAYYLADADRNGTDPFSPNSQLRFLLGHEREVRANLTLGVQYYLEHILHYDALRTNSLNLAFEPSAYRHLLTSRWTYLLRQQTLTLSLFTFWSPNDGDAHVRTAVQRQWSDELSLAFGANLFLGDAPTFFGQLEGNANLYARARYSF